MPYLTSPVKKIVYSDEIGNGPFYIGGVSALSHYSFLNPDDQATVAIWERDFVPDDHSFSEWESSDFKDNYVIIGGTACSVILRNADMKPRATKDIDMILIVEQMTPEFGRLFWEFIHDGQYEMRERKRDEGKEPAPELFRFCRPQTVNSFDGLNGSTSEYVCN